MVPIASTEDQLNGKQGNTQGYNQYDRIQKPRPLLEYGFSIEDH
jgi:hypothetical protein